MDDDNDPSAVSGRTPFCRDVDAKVAGNGPTDRAVIQFSHSRLAADSTLLTLS